MIVLSATDHRINADGEIILISFIVTDFYKSDWRKQWRANIRKLQEMKRGAQRLPNPDIERLVKEHQERNKE